jgi:HPt (histidine-containing phosphotransfer) domain-containing protein
MFGDDDIVKEVLVDFIKPSIEIAAAIKSAYTADSAEAVQQAAHKLKSAARSVGANDLADLCQLLETAGKAGDIDQIGKHIADVDRVMNDVAVYISRYQ